MRFAATTLPVDRWLLPVATGVLLALAYPPFNINQLAWVALVPLLFALENCRRGEAFRRGYIAGLTFFGATLWWTIYTTEGGAPWPAALLGTISLVAFLSLYFGVGAVWFAVMRSRLRWTRADILSDSVGENFAFSIAGSAGWVTLEWVRGWFLFGGFGWNGLGVSQHRVVPLIQLASVTGVYGVSALVCFMNFGFFHTIRRFTRQFSRREAVRRPSWEFYAATLLLCAAFFYGLKQIRPYATREKLRVALVQGNIPQTLKFDPAQKPMILERYRTLTERAMAMNPDLIIWPESATPEPLRYDPESFALVTNLAERAGAYLLTGTLDATPRSSSVEAFNGAILVRPDGTVAGIYHKIHLVPFGEYVPLRKIVPFMKWLTPIEDSFERGREYTVFELPLLVKPVTLSAAKGLATGKAEILPLRGSGLRQEAQNDKQKNGEQDGVARFGAVICFEDTVPELYRQFVKRGVNFMINVTNDAWFKNSPAAEMHLANAIFRCVESQRPLIRCTNNGVTCVVDEFGIVNPETRLPPFTDGVLVCELPLAGAAESTFYTRHGDWFVAVCAAVSMVCIAVVAWRTRRFPLQSST